MQLKSFTFAVLFLVHGTNANNCDGKGAENLIAQLEQFNVLLNSYASMGGNVLSLSASAAKAKATANHLAGRAISQKNREAKPTNRVAGAMHHSHVNAEPALLLDVHPTHLEQAHATHAEQAHNTHVEQAHNTRVIAQAQATHVDQAHNSHIEKGHKQPYVDQPHKQQPSINQVNDEQFHIQQAHIQDAWNQLNAQQTHLDSIADTCIPLTHKLKVASSLKKLLSIYVEKEGNLKAAGKLVVEPKKSKKNRLSSKAKRDLVNRATHPNQAGWLTMGDDVNNGFNGDIGELTSSTTSSTSTGLLGDYGYSAPYSYLGAPPQFSPSYVTVVSTSTPAPPPPPPPVPTPAQKSSQTTSDSADSSDSGSDTDTETGTSNSMTPAPEAPQATSKPHHNIIFRAVGGTFHLVTGTLHFVERILGIGGRSGGSNALATGGGSFAKEGEGEISKLMEKLVERYSH